LTASEKTNEVLERLEQQNEFCVNNSWNWNRNGQSGMACGGERTKVRRSRFGLLGSWSRFLLQ